MAITFSGNVTREAIEQHGPVAISLLRRGIANQILAGASGSNPGHGLSLVDPSAPLDERISWSETSDENGFTLTGALELETAEVA